MQELTLKGFGAAYLFDCISVTSQQFRPLPVAALPGHVAYPHFAPFTCFPLFHLRPSGYAIYVVASPLTPFSLDDRPMEPNAQPPPLPRSSQEPLGCIPYAIGGASFIPLVGVLFGLIAIVWGIARRAWSLIVLGVCGILFTCLVYGALFYFGIFQRGGFYDELRSRLAVTMLNDAVKEIEFYKIQHGHYPASLTEVEPKDKMQINKIIDPTSFQRRGSKDTHFYYELDPSGSFYYLRSVGPDGIPFTSDDILPTITEDTRKNTGLRLQR
jgi:hypothetical protein